MKFSVKDLFSKCEQTRSYLWICSHLLKTWPTIFRNVKYVFRKQPPKPVLENRCSEIHSQNP